MAAGIDRIGALDKAFEFIYKSETDGDYLEFGVYQGVSLARAIKANLTWQRKTKRNHVNRFYGFDSFQGLPAFTHNDRLEGYEVFQERQFNDTSVNLVHEKLLKEGVPTDNLELVPGVFAESLRSLNVLEMLGDAQVAIVHIDCDLYSSAKQCLDFLHGRLADGAIMLFDDWFCYRGRPDRGVHRAFEEWRQEAPYWVSDYFQYSWAGRAFIINIKE